MPIQEAETTGEGKRHIAWEERDSEMGERGPKKSGNRLVEMRKDRGKSELETKTQRWGHRDTGTEMERCPRHSGSRTEGRTHTGKMPSAAHKSGTMTASHLGGAGIPRLRT